MINISKLLKKIIKREADEENQDKTAQNRKDAVKIIQLLPSVSYGDAIGNDVVALRNYLVSKGFHSEIYAKYIDPRMKRTGVNSSTDLPGLQPEDIMLYHFYDDNEDLVKILRKCKCRKIMIYHNITPAEYFKPYDPCIAKRAENGRKQLRKLRSSFECCLAISEYNKQDLRRAGYRCPIGTLPILMPFEDYRQAPDDMVLKKYQADNITNILFVGRVVPHKKQEDVIAAFAYYHTKINSRSRLFIVGNDTAIATYSSRLKRYVKELELENEIIITGHITFPEILAYYQLADVFLCMSEHEGFCVPLIEAMLFSVPILAYRAAAIPDTVGAAGIIMRTKKPVLAAGMLERILNDTALQATLKQQMQLRLEDYSYKKTTDLFAKYLDALLEHRNIEEVAPVAAQETETAKALRETAESWEKEILAENRTADAVISFENIRI